MPWLVRGDRVLASLAVADSPASRIRGLLGRSLHDGALLIRPARSAHTLGMRVPIDVAHLDAELRGSRAVLEAEAGSFQRWDLQVGDELTVRCDGDPVDQGLNR